MYRCAYLQAKKKKKQTNHSKKYCWIFQRGRRNQHRNYRQDEAEPERDPPVLPRSGESHADNSRNEKPERITSCFRAAS